jgi:hypothetical protein
MENEKLEGAKKEREKFYPTNVHIKDLMEHK